MTRYTVTHRTRYTYSSPVSGSYGEAWLLPRSLPNQRCLNATVTITPAPSDQSERVDFFGNRVSYFHLTTSHTELEVTATSTVEVDPGRGALPLVANQPWELVRDPCATLAGPLGTQARHFLLDSPGAPAVPVAYDYAGQSFTPGRPVLDAVGDLASRINADFEFDADATDVTSTIEDLFDGRAGVCQDFAHLLVSCLRAVGLPGRYVSGYLETVPPPGQPKLVGVDVSHAWASVLLPDAGWVDIDPTNNQFVDDRYVTVAWGRDYRDVTPLKGVVYSDAEKTTLEVTVDVSRSS